MPFLTCSSAFAEGELVWKTYMAADDQVGGTLQCKRIYSDANDKALVAQSWRPRISSLQSLPYSDSTAELSECTGINDHPIDLVDKLPSYDLSNHLSALQYCSSTRKTIAFDYVSEVLITWHQELVPVALNWGFTLLVKVSIPTGRGLLPRDFRWIVAPLTSML